jgi:hypothetical protein
MPAFSGKPVTDANQPQKSWLTVFFCADYLGIVRTANLVMPDRSIDAITLATMPY